MRENSEEELLRDIQRLTDLRATLQAIIEQVDSEIAELVGEGLDNEDDVETMGMNGPSPLTERIMGIPNDPQNPLSRRSFEDAFRRMGFPPRRRH
ncbi:MAG: hypothetical protein HY665_05865 [Chloroflexi bacterium]|nr:hypothetical protein [Chloroflexota bacterium]